MKAERLKIVARVVETRDIASAIRLIRFDIPQGLLDLQAGAHVTFEIPKDNGSITRSYSVVDDGQRRGGLTIAVKLEAASKGGSRFMWSLAEGDEISICGNGNAMPPAYAGSDYVVLAGGIGVTPMTGMVRALKRTGKPVRMVYCARSRADAAFVEELQNVMGEALTLYFDSEGQVLDIPALVQDLSARSMLFLCGPQGMMEAVKSAWQAHGLPVQNLRYETFANSGAQPTKAFRVMVEETGRVVDVPEDTSLLDALIASGHDVLSDCRKGECGLCKLEVTEGGGAIDHRDVFLSPDERASNNCLCACVSRISGGEIRIRIDGVQHGRAH